MDHYGKLWNVKIMRKGGDLWSESYLKVFFHSPN
jgi:hypothetical protein